jgi:hypothetical protein
MFPTALRTSLDQAGLKDVSAAQDRDKSVVTLGWARARNRDKMQAESIARSIVGAQVVANQIAVIPPGAESEAKAVNSDLDKGIEKNLDAALIEAKLHDHVTLRRQESCCYSDGRSPLSIEAGTCRNGGVRGSKPATSDECTAGYEAEGQFVERGAKERSL